MDKVRENRFESSGKDAHFRSYLVFMRKRIYSFFCVLSIPLGLTCADIFCTLSLSLSLSFRRDDANDDFDGTMINYYNISATTARKCSSPRNSRTISTTRRARLKPRRSGKRGWAKRWSVTASRC